MTGPYKTDPDQMEEFMGNPLEKVAQRREELRDLLHVVSTHDASGPTLEEEAVQGGAKHYGEEVVINLAFILDFMPIKAGEIASLQDAVAILDHLDTLGMEIRFKQ